MTKKKIFAILSVLLIAILSVSALSYSIAGLSNGDEEAEIEMPAVYNSTPRGEFLTAIDMIIEDSNTEPDYTLNIVEVLPLGAVPSELKDYIANDSFRKFVINANKDKVTDDMKVNTIAYDSVGIAKDTVLSDKMYSNILKGNSEISAIFNAADLIYINSPGYRSFEDGYTATSGMSEDIYDYLHTYASGKNKPVIMNFVKSGDDDNGAQTYANLVDEIKLNYIAYKTFPWVNGYTAEQFFLKKNVDGKGKSHYLPYSESVRDYNVLDISTIAAGGAISDALKDGYNDVKNYVYYGTQTPQDITNNITVVSPTDLTETILNTHYDFIVIESDVLSSPISAAIYTKLKGLSERGRYIFYGTSKVASATGTTSGTTKANNYTKLMSLLMTSNGLSRQDNVMAVRPGFFTTLNANGGNADGLAGAKEIADLFNNSDYRGNTTSGESRKYRVLEIEPSYPIDLDVAEANPTKINSVSNNRLKGGYYTEPDQMVFNLSKDEMADQVHGEYYAFQMTKAKVAKMTGLDYQEIQVDQMSVNEVISQKNVIAETYDMVYIGGNASAYLQNTLVNLGEGTDWTGQYQNDKLNQLTCFDMYTHTAYLAAYQVQDGFGSVGSSDKTSVVVSGHDLTQTKMNELKDYVKAGLPIIIDKKVTDAYSTMAGKQNRLDQLKLHDIDPDSYMAQFLKYALGAKNKGAANISWGEIDGSPKSADQVKINNDGTLGNTYDSTGDGIPDVTVFTSAKNQIAQNLYNSTSKRPVLSIVKAPSEYDQHDKTTVHSETTFSVDVAATEGTGNYKFYLLVDDNGDGVFDYNDGVVDATSECKDSATGTKATLSYDLEEDFFRLISWKVVAYCLDGSGAQTTLCDAKTGAAFFKIDPEAKKTVRVLQIMPITKGYSYSDGHSLFFCTDCEQACGLLNYNITINGHDKYRGSQGLNSNAGSDNKNGTVDGTYLGKHEHDFGIVKYDTNTQIDDWNQNFADELTIGPDGTIDTGDFEFDLDIVSVGDFDRYCAEAAALSPEEAASNYQLVYGEDGLQAKYEAQKESAALKAAEKTLIDEMYKAALVFENVNDSYYRAQGIREGIGDADSPGPWMAKKQYYRIFEYFNSSSSDWNFAGLNARLGGLRSAYATYVAEKDKVLELKEQVKEYSRKSATSNEWIAENYDIVVLGFADEFMNKDLSVDSCSQLKTYITGGGSVLNTHDTMTRKNSGAYNMTSALLEVFGMDRFHVIGVDDGSEAPANPNEAEVKIINQAFVLDASQVQQNFTPYKVVVGGTEDWRIGQAYNVVNDFSCDSDITMNYDWGNVNGGKPVESAVLGATHQGVNYDDVSVTIRLRLTQDNPSNKNNDVTVALVSNNKYIAVGKTDSSGAVTFKLPQVLTGDGFANASEVSLGSFEACNIKATVSMTKNGIQLEAGSLTTSPLDENQEDANIELTVSNYATLPDSASFKLKVGSETRTSTLGLNGAMNFAVPVSAFSSTGGNYQDALNDAQNSTTNYIRYKCGRSYAFFTERIIQGDTTKHNSPLGITDMFASFDSSSHPTNMFKYVVMSNEAFDHANKELDGSGYEAKYGTRRASKINQGGLTLYPFAVADELRVSGTHPQMYTLDLDDPEVNVWYTLSPNYQSEAFLSTGKVDAYWSRYTSGIFAASPKDGMNSYFLYSKGNVFYTGAGHERIVGVFKDNNDERKLFINVIVNSVTKGKKKPKLKLYNVCADHPGGNCDDEFVDPSDVDGNKLLAKEMDTLYYNPAKGFYQYNVEETAEDVYPTFDFRVIAGSYDLKQVQVFYDLDYGDGPGLKESDDYEETYTEYLTNGNIVHNKEVNHYMIFQARNINAKNMNDVRQNLSEAVRGLPLLLRDEFMKNYNGYTYIVIKATDEKGQVRSARVKVLIVPHLFDLTDATIDQKTVGARNSKSVLDITDKSKFNI